jgi:hypothetical protein
MAYLNSYFSDKPQVRLVMSSPSPILETDHKNVTLTCEVETGNPPVLDEVIWYLDGEVLKHLPECNGTEGEGMVSIYLYFLNDYTELIMLNVRLYVVPDVQQVVPFA